MRKVDMEYRDGKKEDREGEKGVRERVGYSVRVEGFKEEGGWEKEEIFFFSSRRRHTRSSTVSWARECV